jgi:hypothetical protein
MINRRKLLSAGLLTTLAWLIGLRPGRVIAAPDAIDNPLDKDDDHLRDWARLFRERLAAGHGCHGGNGSDNYELRFDLSKFPNTRITDLSKQQLRQITTAACLVCGTIYKTPDDMTRRGTQRLPVPAK